MSLEAVFTLEMEISMSLLPSRSLMFKADAREFISSVLPLASHPNLMARAFPSRREGEIF